MSLALLNINANLKIKICHINKLYLSDLIGFQTLLQSTLKDPLLHLESLLSNLASTNVSQPKCGSFGQFFKKLIQVYLSFKFQVTFMKPCQNSCNKEK